MPVTDDNGNVKAEDLAEFIWCAEYDGEEYPWGERSDDEKSYYRDCARALLRSFDIIPK